MTVVLMYSLYFTVLSQIACLKSDVVTKVEFHRLQNEMKVIISLFSETDNLVQERQAIFDFQ